MIDKPVVGMLAFDESRPGFPITRFNVVSPSFPIRGENHEFEKCFGSFWPAIEVCRVEMASNRV